MVASTCDAHVTELCQAALRPLPVNRACWAGRPGSIFFCGWYSSKHLKLYGIMSHFCCWVVAAILLFENEYKTKQRLLIWCRIQLVADLPINVQVSSQLAHVRSNRMQPFAIIYAKPTGQKSCCDSHCSRITLPVDLARYPYYSLIPGYAAATLVAFYTRSWARYSSESPGFSFVCLC